MVGWGSVMAQSWPGANNRSSSQPQCGVDLSVNTIGPGDYIQFNAVNTAQYFFNNCASANWDTDLAIFRTDNASQLAYTDGGPVGNACTGFPTCVTGSCGWQVTNFDWTSSYTGQVRVIQPRYNNQGSGTSYGWISGINSATLTYRQVKNFTNTTSNATICVGGTKSLTQTGIGTGGTWSIQAGGGSLSGTTYTATSAGAKIIRYTLGSCFEDVSFSVVAAPDLSAPTFTNSAICTGGSTQVTSNLTGGTGTQEPVWQYFNGSTWVNVANGTPAGATYTNATTATLTISGISVANNYQYRRFLNPTGLGCSANSGGATLSVVNDPALSDATLANSSICVGGSTTVTSNISGGTGAQVPVWQVNTGSGWVTVTNGVPAGAVYTSTDGSTMSIAGITATGNVQYRRILSNTSLGCDAVSNAVTLNVSNQPTAASIQRIPNTSPVCAGTDLTVSITGSSSGGSGTCADEFRFSTNGGPFTDWTAGPPPTVSSSSITSGPGTIIIQTRRNCSGGGCNSNINQVQWDVNPVPNAVATPISQAFCSGESTNIALTTSPSLGSVSFAWTVPVGTNNIFGQFGSSGSNISQTLFNEDGSNSETITYTITPTRASCSGTPITVPITVHPIPVAIATPSSQSVCNGQTTAINLTSPVSGTNFNWTVTGPPAAGGFTNAAGTQINQTLTNSSSSPVAVTYTVTPSTANCTGSPITVQITVNPTPAVTFNSFGGPYCISDNTPISLVPFGIPAGGTFSGPGVAGNDFVPALAAVGTNTITYSFSDINGCPNTATTTVQVTGLPLVSFSGLSTSGYCVNDNSPVTLTGFPAAPGTGVFSGPGISGNAFTPSVAGVGLHAITYTYTDANGCVGTQTQSVNVFALPNLGIFDLASSYCVDDAPVTASGFPPGGTFSGPGITGAGVFTPATATVGGPYTITYQFTDGNGCTNTTTSTTVVHPLPTVSFSGLAADYCIDAASVTLTGSPVGGTFTGPGMTTGGVFTPSVAGLGAHSITYSFTDGNGCTNFQTQTVEVTGIPGVTFTGLASAYCIDASTVTLTGNNAPDGSFSGPGITDNGNGTATFNPATAGIGGPYNITYSFTNPLGCGFAETQQVVVNPLPDLSFTGLAAAYCVDAPSITLTGSFAPGGSFSGGGITDNGNGTATFSPSAAGSGPASITYEFTNANGCFNTNTQGTTVNALPTVSYTGFGDVCVDQPAQPLTGSPTGGVFSGAGVSGNQFFPAITGVGTFPVTYTFTDGNGCDDTFTENFTVHNIPVVTVNPASVQVCPGDAVTFLVSATGIGLSYQWQVNTGSGFVNLNNGGIYSGVNTQFLNVGPIAQSLNGFQYRVLITGSTCGTQVFSNSAAINISSSPVVDVQPADQFVCDGDDAQFSVSATGSGLNYQWQINTGSGWTALTNDAIYSGVTTNTLTVSGYDAAMDGDLFRVVISGSSNCTSSTTSQVASLNGSSSPVILNQPTNQSVCEGSTTVFAVSGGGTGLIYQWQVNDGSGWVDVADGGIYSGSGSDELTLTGITSVQDGYLFRVNISNASCPGSSLSDEVTLTITTSPAIVQQPANAQVCSGDDASFTVVADGSGNTYQWQINTGSGFTNLTNGGPYSGATTTTLNVNGVNAGMDGHQFRVIVQNSQCASASTSAVATLSQSVSPIISMQPADGYFCVGDDVTFSASANGSSLTYQWQVNTGSGWVNVANNATYSGANTVSLTVAGTTSAMNGHRFRLIVAGSVNCSGTALTAVVELIETNEPLILTQPLNQGVCENSGASFTVNVPGNVTYQWQLNSGSGFADVADGGIYSGATTATLNLSAVALADDGNQYRVVVSGVNCTGDATSQIATLSITDEPVIASQSPDQYVCTGDDAVFAVSVDGTGLIYQWQEDDGTGFVDIVDGGDYSGANTAVLTIQGATPSYNGFGYRVIVESGNCVAAATSEVAFLFENAGPVVLVEPNDAQVCPNDNAVFSVSAGGTSLTYQWQVNTGSGFTNLNDNNIYSGTTTSSLLVQGATTAMNNHQFRAIIEGSVNCAVDAVSDYGVLTVSPNPTITQQPADLSFCDGDNASLTVAANGAQGFQWQENTGTGWVNLSNGGIYAGVNTLTLSLSGIPAANDGFQYRVVVSGSSNCQGTATSAAVTITEDPNPFIAQQPVDQFVCPGDAATFTVLATGSGLVYQWQEDTGLGFVDIADGGVYNGATTATLTISDGTGLDGNQYRAIITGSICSGSSALQMWSY
jgi:hypothetical protein